MLCVKNGRIHDAVHETPYQADLLIENGKIRAIGEDLEGDETIGWRFILDLWMPIRTLVWTALQPVPLEWIIMK